MTRLALPSYWRHAIVSAHRARAIGKIEVSANRGQLVDYVVRADGGNLGDYYCCHAVATTFADILGLASPIVRSGSCSQQRIRAKKFGALRSRTEFDAARLKDPMCVAAWIFLVIDTHASADGEGLPGHAHHTGIVGEVQNGVIVTRGPRGGFYTVEANAADPLKTASRDGDGWYHGRERGHPGDAALYEFIDPAAFPL